MSSIAAPAERSATFTLRKTDNRAMLAGTLALLGVGAVLRIARWIHWRSLWLDEIYLARSVLSRNLQDLLFRPLDDWQAAPAGFLLLVHLCVGILGSGERSLRLVSQIFGLASLPLMFFVARRVLSPRGSMFAMALFAFLGPLIYYSNELKPYSCDVAFSLAITLTILRFVEKPTGARAAMAAFVGALGIFLSYPAIFVLAGVALVVLWRERAIPRTRQMLVYSIWMIAFALNYILFIRPLSRGEAHPHLLEFWQAHDAFMPRNPIATIRWIFNRFWQIARDPSAMWISCPGATQAALILGLMFGFQREKKLWFVLSPVPFVILASAFRQYPFGERLVLFLVPQLIIFIAAGLDALCEERVGTIAALALGAMILVPSAWRASGYFFRPPGREESLPAYRWIAGQWERGDVLYLSHMAEPSFRFYKHQSNWRVEVDDPSSLHIAETFSQPNLLENDVKLLHGQARVWVVLIHTEGGAFDEEPIARAAFDQIGKPRLEHLETGAKVYLYDCSSSQASNP